MNDKRILVVDDETDLLEEENPSKPVALVTIKGIGYRLNIKGVQT